MVRVLDNKSLYRYIHSVVDVCGLQPLCRAAQTVVIKEPNSFSHVSNKRLVFLSRQGREMQTAGFLSADKNTFLWVLELAVWPRLKTFPDGGKTVLSEIRGTDL